MTLLQMIRSRPAMIATTVIIFGRTRCNAFESPVHGDGPVAEPVEVPESER